MYQGWKGSNSRDDGQTSRTPPRSRSRIRSDPDGRSSRRDQSRSSRNERRSSRDQSGRRRDQGSGRRDQGGGGRSQGSTGGQREDGGKGLDGEGRSEGVCGLGDDDCIPVDPLIRSGPVPSNESSQTTRTKAKRKQRRDEA